MLRLTISVLLAFAFSRHVPAAELSPELHFRRCYNQLVRARPAEDDPDLVAVKLGSSDPVAACMHLLERARLGADGKVNLKDPAARRILRTLQSLHSSWFPTHELVQAETDFPTTNHFDTNEMGYHFTRQLLSPSQRFSAVVTSPRSWAGIRQPSLQPKYFLDTRGNNEVLKFSEGIWGPNKNGAYAPNLITLGRLVGIQELVPEPILSRDLRDHTIEFSPTQSLGAGILGTPTYIMLSSTMERNAKPDGELHMHRAWSRAVLKDLLCRDLPVIRPEDVRGVESDSPVPFRRHSSCMQCHATMDPMSAVLRNVEMTVTHNPEGKHFSSRAVFANEVRNELRGPAQFHGNYFQSVPTGTLYLRDFEGSLVDKDVDNLKEMGLLLASLDDLYVCTAKKYFDFFTGIDVQIRDFSKDGPAVKKSAYLKYRQFVIELGRGLKADQSLPKLFERIIGSDFYRSSSYGVDP
jgi:hypothetical protein